MKTKLEFLDDIWHSVVEKAQNWWLKNFSSTISKKVFKSIISQIKDYLSLNSVYINVYDCDFVHLILSDFKEAIFNYLHRYDDYVFVKNFKCSDRHEKNNLRENLMVYDEFFDFESYREILKLAYNPSTRGGRKPYDPVFMYKITYLKFVFNKTDKQMIDEIQNNEAYKCFLGYPEEIPCTSTFWNFRERIVEKSLDDQIWDFSHILIEKKSIHRSKVTMQDASFFETNPGHKKVSFPRGKEAKTRRSKDGTFVKKGKKTFFGYKIHSEMDLRSYIIYNFDVTTASLHDININLTDKDRIDYKDRGYSKKEFRQVNGIMMKSARNHPINAHEKRRNRRISSKRAPGERLYTILENIANKKTKLTEIKRVKIQIMNILLYFNIQQVIRIKNGEKINIGEKIEEMEENNNTFPFFDFFNNSSIYFENSNYINFAINTLGKKYIKIPQIEITKKNNENNTISTSKAEYRRTIKRKLAKKRKQQRKRINKEYKEMQKSCNEFNLTIP
jgi:IS5 family transposase